MSFQVKLFIFKTYEPIKYFSAYLGNSSVPYPVAYSDNYAYVFSEFIVLKLKDIDVSGYSKGFFSNPWHTDKLIGLCYGNLQNIDGEKVQVSKTALNYDILYEPRLSDE